MSSLTRILSISILGWLIFNNALCQSVNTEQATAQMRAAYFTSLIHQKCFLSDSVYNVVNQINYETALEMDSIKANTSGMIAVSAMVRADNHRDKRITRLLTASQKSVYWQIKEQIKSSMKRRNRN